MAPLIYSAIASLDGYVADESGSFDDPDELFLSPVVVGGGTPALPDSVEQRLDLVDERRFGNGVVHLHYAIRTSRGNALDPVG